MIFILFKYRNLMRNLEILSKFSDTLSLQETEEILNASSDEYERLFAIYTSKNRLIVYKYGTDEDPTVIKLQAQVSLSDWNPNLDNSQIVQLDYIQSYQGFMFTYACGNMLQFKIQDSWIEEVGEITVGILAAAWSPNQELLAIATRKNELILFSPEFEIVSESQIDDNDLTFWDHKQGQTQDTTISDAMISWRGDSAIFVINYSINGGRKCLTREANNNLKVSKGPARADYQVVHSVSERPIPIELPMCFMPNGSLVAGFQNRKLADGKLQPEIIFWERNGLRHGEFVLSAKDSVQVSRIQFNQETTLLAVIADFNGQERVQIYTRSNWKWYHKQLLQFQDRIAHFSWLNKHKIFIVLSNGFVQFVDFGLNYLSSNSMYNHANDSAYTLVVDGSSVQLTPLGKMMMPPPMFEKQIILDSFPVCTSMFGHNICAITASGNLHCIDAQQTETQIVCQNLHDVSHVLNYTYENKDFVVLVQSGIHSDKIQIFQIKDSSAVIIACSNLDFKIQNMCLCANLTTSQEFKNEGQENNYYSLVQGWSSDEPGPVSLIVQATNKVFYRIGINGNQISDPDLLFKIDHLALSIKSCYLSGQEAIISLTSNMKLYVNGKILSEQCTSMTVTQNFLLFVNTTSGLMHEMILYNLNHTLPYPGQKTQNSEFNLRTVERGARLVSVCGTKVVLQMPRGNLEGIQPRILMLKETVMLVSTMEYGKAFRLLRQHKIDINLLFDVNPEQFLNNIDKFVKEVSQIDYLNLFINSLNQETSGKDLDYMMPQSSDQMVQMQHERYMQQYQVTQTVQFNKINTVCDALKIALEKVNDENKYLLPLLTTYIKREPQELKEVLAKIQNMQKYEQENNLHSKVIPPHLNPQTMKRDVDESALKLGSKEALEYVSWLVQPDRLFDVALTTYDLDLVCLVASQTQKDPKEYVPRLQELKAMPQAYMRFKIHFDLKQFEQALEALSKSDQQSHFDEALTLIKKQRLYKQAVKFYSLDQSKLSVVQQAFAEYLDQRGYCDEAGYMFMQSGHLDQALEAFKRALNVCMVHSVAARQGLDAEHMLKLNSELVDLLYRSNRYEQAAALVDPFTDFELALDCQLRSNNFNGAIKICLQTNNQLTSVKHAVVVANDLKSNQLKGVLDQFSKRLLRLKTLQHSKRQMPVSSLQQNFELDSDTLSVSQASESQRSMTSKKSQTMSETSKKSRKQHARQMKKKRDCKQGSPFEEDNLIELLKEETKISDEDKSQAKVLMQALIFFNMLEESIQLHDLTLKVIKASFEVEKLFTVEQQRIFESQPDLKMVFQFGPQESRIKKAIEDWDNQKCFKH